MRRILPLTATLMLALPVAGASADARLESTFQDDPRILGADASIRDRTLDEARALGVRRVRVTAFWSRIAPDATSATRPAGFDASDPAAYPAERWATLDAVVQAVRSRGMAINLNVTAPGPLWAGSDVFDARLASVTNPSPTEFGAFVTALGRRYGGAFVPAGGATPLPRIDYWSVWNEPNQGAWLAPQWSSTGRRAVPASPQQYRALVGAAWAGLAASGHGVETDTILVGDTAPKGRATVAARSDAMAPIPFLRRLYCLDDALRPLQGAAATGAGCPADPDPAAFVAQHPALFSMSGWAHHPYELTFAPTTPPARPREYVTAANLSSLTDQLDGIMRRYGVERPRVPLYLTSFGYQTDPPDDQGVSLRAQAAYINQVEYLAWRNPRVRTLAQTLLQDDGPVGRGRDRWGSSFQTGLRFGPESGRRGRAKPALAAYRVALELPRRTARASRTLQVWGRVRPGQGVRTVQVQVRGARGGFRTRRTVRTDRHGFVSRGVRVRAGDRAVRLRSVAGRTVRLSRVAPFRVRG